MNACQLDYLPANADSTLPHFTPFNVPTAVAAQQP